MRKMLLDGVSWVFGGKHSRRIRNLKNLRDEVVEYAEEIVASMNEDRQEGEELETLPDMSVLDEPVPQKLTVKAFWPVYLAEGGCKTFDERLSVELPEGATALHLLFALNKLLPPMLKHTDHRYLEGVQVHPDGLHEVWLRS